MVNLLPGVWRRSIFRGVFGMTQCNKIQDFVKDQETRIKNQETRIKIIALFKSKRIQ
jgi:hypothetical protein